MRNERSVSYYRGLDLAKKNKKPQITQIPQIKTRERIHHEGHEEHEGKSSKMILLRVLRGESFLPPGVPVGFLLVVT